MKRWRLTVSENRTDKVLDDVDEYTSEASARAAADVFHRLLYGGGDIMELPKTVGRPQGYVRLQSRTHTYEIQPVRDGENNPGATRG